jgi:hypothetical protein
VCKRDRAAVPYLWITFTTVITYWGFRASAQSFDRHQAPAQLDTLRLQQPDLRSAVAVLASARVYQTAALRSCSSPWNPPGHVCQAELEQRLALGVGQDELLGKLRGCRCRRRPDQSCSQARSACRRGRGHRCHGTAPARSGRFHCRIWTVSSGVRGSRTCRTLRCGFIPKLHHPTAPSLASEGH